MSDTLELDLHDLRAAVGNYAGYGAGAFRFGDTEWTADQKRQIYEAVKSGCRWVYCTDEMEGIPGNYSWSFLQPRSPVPIAQDATFVNLPRDFNGFVNDIIPVSEGSAEFRIKVVPYDAIYAIRGESPNQSGRPAYACVEITRGTTADQGSRYKLHVHPANDAARTLQLWYKISPSPLSEEFPHPYGGVPLAETFKAAVVAAYADEWEGGTPAAEMKLQRFREKLRAAIAADRNYKPLTIGYNRDRSDDAGLIGCRHEVPFFVNGVDYSEAI